MALRWTIAFLAVAASCSTPAPPSTTAAGRPLENKTNALERSAELLQRMAPIGAISFYLDGFHAMKDAPAMQMEAHHFCNQVNEELAQCIIYDGNTKQSNMVGVEYIISDRLFAELPAEEKASWHPHNYEILSGALVAPGLPDAAEKAFMRTKLNSYGKTWHIWDTGHMGVAAGHALPVGEPKLAWSFNADDEMQQSLLEDRDRRLKIDSRKKRLQRQDMAVLARPQHGVNTLATAFPERKPLEAVRDADTARGQ